MKNVRLTSRAAREQVWPALDEDVLETQTAELRREVRAQVRSELIRATHAASRTERPVETSWMSMPEWERARIRPARRRTAAGLLVLVRGEGAGVPAAGEGEAA